MMGLVSLLILHTFIMQEICGASDLILCLSLQLSVNHTITGTGALPCDLSLFVGYKENFNYLKYCD
jgi:hypothetical protein